MERVKGQNEQIMRGFVMREALAWKTSLLVSEGDVFAILLQGCVESLESWSGCKKTVKAWVVWQQKTLRLAWFGMSQKQRFKGTSLLYLYTLPEDQTSTKDTHLWAAALSVCFLSKAEPWPWGPEDALEGSNAFWSSYSSWEFSRATSEPGCHTSGGHRGAL